MNRWGLNPGPLSYEMYSSPLLYHLQCELQSYRWKSKAPVSQLVNADDTSVIEIKTQLYLES